MLAVVTVSAYCYSPKERLTEIIIQLVNKAGMLL